MTAGPWRDKLLDVATSIDTYMGDEPLPPAPDVYGAPLGAEFKRWAASASVFADLRLDWDQLFTIAEYFDVMTETPAWQRIAALALAKAAALDPSPGSIGSMAAHSLSYWIPEQGPEVPGADPMRPSDLPILLSLFEALIEVPPSPDDYYDEFGYFRFGQTVRQLRAEVLGASPAHLQRRRSNEGTGSFGSRGLFRDKRTT